MLNEWASEQVNKWTKELYECVYLQVPLFGPLFDGAVVDFANCMSVCVCLQVPLFGPLFDGAIVDFASLPGLVRETAVNAGNMICTLKPYYKTLYPQLL